MNKTGLLLLGFISLTGCMTPKASRMSFEQGRSLFASGNYTEAKVNLERYLEINPTDLEAKDLLDRTNKLIKFTNSPTDDHNPSPPECRILYSQGLDAFKAKNYALARDRFDAILKIDPQNPEAKRYVELCTRLIETPNPEK